MKTIDKIKVKNMTSPSYGGREVPNQFIIRTEDGTYFQSYNKIIAFEDRQGRIFLDKENWEYSRTTGKYRNQFLGEKKKETLKKIKAGIYKLRNLN